MALSLGEKEPPTFTGRRVQEQYGMKILTIVYMCTRNCIDIPTYKRIDIFTYSCIDKNTYLLVYMGTGLQNVIDILSLAVLDFNGAMLALIAANAVPE